MTFKVIDTKTGKEPTGQVIKHIAKIGNLMEADIDGFYVGEDGEIILVDECGNATWMVDQERFKVVLEQEPKIVPIAEIKFDDDMLHEIVEEAVKNIEIEPKWISVSEMMPQINEWVVCQCRANIYEVLKFTSYGWYHDDAHCYMDGFVIAWMPLPESYKGE